MENEKRETLINRLIAKAETLEEYEVLAKFLSKSKILPKHITSLENPTDMMLILDHGLAMGLTWFEALTSLIPKDGGHLIMKGDAAKALVMSKRNVRFEEIYEGKFEDNTLTCTIICFQENTRENSASFSLQDAIRAELYVPDSPVKSYYKMYPERTIKYRALSFLLRDTFPDILKNVWTEEEYQDFRGVGEVVSSKDGKEFLFPDAEAKLKATQKSADSIKAKDSLANVMSKTEPAKAEPAKAEPSEKEDEAKSFVAQEESFNEEKPDRLMWYYYPDTDALMTGLESEADSERLKECTMIGEATRPTDIEEGRQLRDSYNPSAEPDEPLEEEIAPSWEQLESHLSSLKGAEVIEWISDNVEDNRALNEIIDLLPQRRTTKAMVPIIGAYLEGGKEFAMLYMKKTYPEVFNEEEEKPSSPEKDPDEVEAPKAESPNPEEKAADNETPKPKETDTSEGNLLGLPVQPLHGGSRDIAKVMKDVYMPLLKPENSKYFKFIREACGGDDELDDFLTTNPMDEVNSLINKAVNEA